MEFLGETEKFWFAANFYDKSLVYKFPKRGYPDGWQINTLRKFNINRLSKKLKHKYKIKDVLRLNLGKPHWARYQEVRQAIVRVQNYKLRYDPYRKKCYAGYKTEPINLHDYPKELREWVPRAVLEASETSLIKIFNYSEIWEATNGA